MRGGGRGWSEGERGGKSRYGTSNSCTMTNLVYGICTASAFYVFPRAQPEGIHIMHEWYKSIHQS